MDLRGHGRSTWLPPWNLETHIGDLAEAAAVHAVEHATWIGFSLGGRLVAELALHDHRLVDRLVVLEPVLHLPPEDGLEAAERERHEETYATADEAVATLAVAIGLPTPRRTLRRRHASTSPRRPTAGSGSATPRAPPLPPGERRAGRPCRPLAYPP